MHNHDKVRRKLQWQACARCQPTPRNLRRVRCQVKIGKANLATEQKGHLHVHERHTQAKRTQPDVGLPKIPIFSSFSMQPFLNTIHEDAIHVCAKESWQEGRNAIATHTCAPSATNAATAKRLKHRHVPRVRHPHTPTHSRCTKKMSTLCDPHL